jgi:hypothetical protein
MPQRTRETRGPVAHPYGRCGAYGRARPARAFARIQHRNPVRGRPSDRPLGGRAASASPPSPSVSLTSAVRQILASQSVCCRATRGLWIYVRKWPSRVYRDAGQARPRTDLTGSVEPRMDNRQERATSHHCRDDAQAVCLSHASFTSGPQLVPLWAAGPVVLALSSLTRLLAAAAPKRLMRSRASITFGASR